MANWYVYSGAAGAGTGADWANAYLTLAAAATAKAAGDVFFVAHDHAETAGAANTITFPGTELLPNRVYCVDRAGSVPPVAADLRDTATITTTGAFGITVGGSLAECYGIKFLAGSGAVQAIINLGNTALRSQRFTKCLFALVATATTSRINFNNAANANVTHVRDCTVSFSAVAQFMNNAARVVWRNNQTSILAAGSLIPTLLMSFSATGSWFFEGVDFSAMTSGKNLVNGATTNPNCSAVFKDCKLGAGGIVSALPTVFGGVEVTAIRCDSGDTNYRIAKYAFGGSLITETTIVRAGGASDGTTPISWRLDTTANTEWEWPLESLPIYVWNETVGTPITVTVQGIWGGATLNNDDVWIDVVHLGASGFPLGVEASGTRGILAANTPHPAGSGTWGGSTTKFAMSVTFTPQEKGPLTIYVKVARPSTQLWVDPKPVIS